MATGQIDLTGKVALVCGSGGGGVGDATARGLAQAGATVFAVDRTEELLTTTMDELRQLGAKVDGLVADLRVADQVDDIVPAALKAFQRIDLVTNIAGGTQQGESFGIAETPRDVFRRVMALNFDYVFQVCGQAGAAMISQGGGGSIVNISSVSGVRAAPNHAVYGAAKAAVIAATRSMAIEWGAHNIRANVVVPGAVATARAGDRAKRFEELAPLKRPASPQDIANAILFLFSDLSAGITGQEIVVDTGLTAKSVTG